MVNLKQKVFLLGFFFNVFFLSAVTAEEYTLEAYMKVRSMKEMPKVMAAAKQSEIPKEYLATPNFVLAVLGYPGFPDIQDGNSALLFYRDRNDGKHYFFLGKIVSNSNLENAIKAFGWGMESYKGWTIIGKSLSAIQKISNKDDLISLIEATPQDGLEISFLNKNSESFSCSDSQWLMMLASVKSAQFNVNVQDNGVNISSKVHFFEPFLKRLQKVPFTKRSASGLSDPTSEVITIDTSDLPKVYQSMRNEVDREYFSKCLEYRYGMPDYASIYNFGSM